MYEPRGDLGDKSGEREREREKLDRHRLRRRGTLLFRSLPDIEGTWSRCPRIPDTFRISARVTLIRAPITNCRDSPVSRKRDDSLDHSRVYTRIHIYMYIRGSGWKAQIYEDFPS